MLKVAYHNINRLNNPLHSVFFSPEDDTDSARRLKSVSCVLTQNSISMTGGGGGETKDRQSSMSNFFEMESADDTLDAMVAPPETFASGTGSPKDSAANYRQSIN